MEQDNPQSSAEQQRKTAERMEQMAQQEQRIAERAAAIKHKFAIISGKGGVGKTTVAVGLATALAQMKYRVGLFDTDVTGPNVPRMMGLEGRKPAMAPDGKLIAPIVSPTGVKVISMGFLTQEKDTPIIWRGPLRGMAVRQLIADVDWGELDYLIIDLPPGTGDEPLTIAQSLPQIDGMIVVSTPQQASTDDCRKAINFARQLEVAILGVIENMSGFVCPHCGNEIPIFGTGGGEKMAQEMGVQFLARLPIAPEVVQLTDQGHSPTDSAAPEAIRKAFTSIVEKLPQ